MNVMKDNIMLESLKVLYNEVIQIVGQLIKVTEMNGFTNEQAFIDFQDELNKLSIYEYGRKNEE